MNLGVRASLVNSARSQRKENVYDVSKSALEFYDCVLPRSCPKKGEDFCDPDFIVIAFSIAEKFVHIQFPPFAGEHRQKNLVLVVVIRLPSRRVSMFMKLSMFSKKFPLNLPPKKFSLNLSLPHPKIPEVLNDSSQLLWNLNQFH